MWLRRIHCWCDIWLFWRWTLAWANRPGNQQCVVEECLSPHIADREQGIDRKRQRRKSEIFKRLLTQHFVHLISTFFQLAAQPLPHWSIQRCLEPDVLGGADVAILAQYSVSKLYTDPLPFPLPSICLGVGGNSTDHLFGSFDLHHVWQSAVSCVNVRALDTSDATLWLVTNGNECHLVHENSISEKP